MRDPHHGLRRARGSRRSVRWPLLLPAAALLAGCAAAMRDAGTEAEVLAQRGQPSARHPMAAGATRLEYASGPYGRTTWMVDIDAAGRVVAANQVLNEANLNAFQASAPGMSRADVLRTLGRPGERKSGGRQGGEVWSWRYPTNDCLWYQVSIGDDGIARGATYGIDWRCDAASGRD